MDTYANFQSLDIRVGTIVSAEEFPEARKPAYKLKVDLGGIGIKNSSAQITQLYPANELVGRQVIAVVNFPPRQIGKFISEILVLGVYGNDGEVILLQPDRKMENGSKIG